MADIDFMSEHVTRFCTGRFEDLKQYLEGVTLRDWAKFDAFEVADLVPAERRMLTAVLHRELQTQGYFKGPSQDFSETRFRTLDLRSAVTSKSFMTGRSLEERLAAFEDPQLMNLDLIDLRFCNLLDMDAGDVLTLCRRTQREADEPPKLVVDLSGNRFTPESIPTLAQVCLLDQVAYVYVPEIGRFGAKEQFADPQFSLHIFNKLIFINKPQLNFDGWRSVVPEALQQTVSKIHEAFYAAHKEFGSVRI
jgi:hypothetical protein